MARELHFICGNWIWDGHRVLECLVAAFEHGLPILEDIDDAFTGLAPASVAARQLQVMLELGVKEGCDDNEADLRRTERWDLIDILTRSRYAKASDPRDHLFALLGLSAQSEEVSLQPDYARSAQDAYGKFVDWCLLTNNGAKLLYNANYMRSNLGIPSWMPDWSLPGSPVFQLAPEIFRRGSRQTAYVNAGGRSGEMSLNLNLRELRVRGYMVDTITRIGKQHFLGAEADAVEQGRVKHASLKDLIMESIVEMGCMIGLDDLFSEKANPKTEIIRRTATWNRRANQQEEAPQSFGMSFRAFLLHSRFCIREKIDRAGALNDLVSNWSTLQAPETASAGQSTQVDHKPKAVLRVLTSPFRNRQDRRSAILKTVEAHAYTFERAAIAPWIQTRSCLTAHGRLASVPLEALVGDTICVIKSAAVPFVLRKGKKGHLLVGQCYLDGFMKGEVLGMGDYQVHELVLI
jgi:hypothetical protein